MKTPSSEIFGLFGIFLDTFLKKEMEEIKTEPLDFVREFQEYLTQQTQHVNMISGSVCGEKESGVAYQAVAPRSVQNGGDRPSVEVSLSMDEGTDVQMDGPERTCDGKYKCSYCNYANKGMARLIEHIRIHTGEKPHRCQLCPFASAYERHLEAHMRSHTGEKPYKCDLCAFRCSDRSNLSHHRRRRHKLLPTRVIRAPFTAKRMLSSLQKKTNSLGYSRRLLININSPSAGLPKSDYLDDFSHKMHHHSYKHPPKVDEREGNSGCANDLTFPNPLDQLSTLAGQLTDIHPESQTPASPDSEEKPILIQQVTTEQGTVTMDGVQPPPPQREPPTPGYTSCHADPDDTFVCSTVTPEKSHQNVSETAPTTSDQRLLYKCQHCEVQFRDNILYTIHMGCHSYEHPFKCNICGHLCFDRYDFACHFARGQHKQK